MMAKIIDRARLKSEMKDLLRDARVSPKGITALYLAIVTVLNLLQLFAGGGVQSGNPLGLFVTILVFLITLLLASGYTLYCMAVRRGQRAEYLTLFDGFSLAGKLIGLQIVVIFFVFLWSLLFVIPGIIAAYRYRFARYNLLENPELGILEALDMSKRQTFGYKGQLFMLDLSYLGWAILGELPSLVEQFFLYQYTFQTILTTGQLPADGVLVFTLGLPYGVWLALKSVWSLVVALFYLPVYQCTELGYFTVAKETSGVGIQEDTGSDQ